MKSQVIVKTTALRKRKVFVGLSGGVDSSVSAWLLKKQGFDVTGVFIKVWQPDFDGHNQDNNHWCTWREDRLDAMRVCAVLDIPFITLDLSSEYKKSVVDYMIAEYGAGRTPNPDVMCNRYVKFGGFFDWAMKQGADFVATGHYARTSNGFNERTALLTGLDHNKDQSYFLWTLTHSQLSHVIFPVGGIEKSEVRKLADKAGLPTATKKDSQGLCFVGKIDVKEFLKSHIKSERGRVLNEAGDEIGWHDGAAFLTIGERHHFAVELSKLSSDIKSSVAVDSSQKPLYVISKDLKKNTITVSPKNSIGETAEAKCEVFIGKVNWVSGEHPDFSKWYWARARYRQPLQEVRIAPKGGSNSFSIRFKSPQTVAQGQSLVLYDGEICLGGGIIE